MDRLLKCEDGQAQVEYGLLAALVAVVALGVLAVMGRRNKDVYVSVNDTTKTVAPPGAGAEGGIGTTMKGKHW